MTDLEAAALRIKEDCGDAITDAEALAFASRIDSAKYEMPYEKDCAEKALENLMDIFWKRRKNKVSALALSKAVDNVRANIEAQYCQNRKVRHLMRYAKKRRVRKKNFNRAIKIIEKDIK